MFCRYFTLDIDDIVVVTVDVYFYFFLIIFFFIFPCFLYDIHIVVMFYRIMNTDKSAKPIYYRHLILPKKKIVISKT